MIDKIKDMIGVGKDLDDKIILLDPSLTGPKEPDLRIVGLFADVNDEKVADIIHNVLFYNEMNLQSKPEEQKPIKFYISTYGGNADDMFALFDVMRHIRDHTEIHTIGLGKVMSAGVLILAAGTKGKRKIGKNCRVMIHSVMGGNHGSLHNMMNEMEAIEQLQDLYCDALISETKLTRVKLKNMLERKVNVYLSAEEAVELGIADEII
tara:strand:- start:14 stop:637 length:624 start_codon:yes stop_codon:yes gene_type:complete